MISATSPEEVVLEGRQYEIDLKIEIKDAGGTFKDYSDYLDLNLQDRAEITVDVDARIKQATIELIREEQGNSIAPLLNSDIAVGRAVRITGARVAAGAGFSPTDYKPLFLGTVDEWGHGAVGSDEDSNSIKLVARDQLAKPQDRFVEVETQYGSDDGVLIEDVMQQILDDWCDGVVLYVPSPTSVVAGPFLQARGSVLDAIQSLADLVGWIIEDRWDSGTDAWRITLYEPNRAATSTDWDFGPSDYFSVEQLDVQIYHIRNVVTVSYMNSVTKAREEYTATDPTSVSKYGRRWMEIQESDDSPINAPLLAQNMADPAVLDLAEPDAVQEITFPLFWGVQLGDFYGFGANGVHYDVDQAFGVTGYTHSFANGEATTAVRTRGKPVGSVRGWLKRSNKGRPTGDTAEGLRILNFRIISRTPTEITYSWDLGADLAESWVHSYLEQQPYSDDRWPGPARVPDYVFDDRSPILTVAIPEQGFERYLQVEGRTTDGSLGAVERALIFPSNVQGDFIAFLAVKVNQADGSAELRGWATERALSVAFAYNVGDPDRPAPTVLDAESQGGGADGGDLLTGFTSDFITTLPAGTVGYGQTIKVMAVAYIFADGTGADGTAADHGPPVGAQDERIKIESSDQIANGIVLAAKLKEGQQSFIIVGIPFTASAWNQVDWTSFTLTLASGGSYSIASGNTGALGSDAIRYIYWDPDASITVLQVSTSAAAATGDRKILLCIARRALAGSSSGQLAFFVPAVGVFGLDGSVIGPNAITSTKITDDSITTPKLVANAVTAAKIAANTITASQIAANTITAGQIAANTITAAELNVATLSAISADLGTETAGTISSGVIVSTGVFTAPAAEFTGYVSIKDQDSFQAAAVLHQSWLELSNLVGGVATIAGAFDIVDGLDFKDVLFYRFDAPIIVDSGYGPKQILEGADDSAGSGYRMLMVPN